MDQIWKPVVGYEGIYEISSCGFVRTVEGKTTHSARHGERVWKQRTLKQKTDKNGYKRVALWKDKQPKTFLVHRLVGEAFLEKDESRLLINHKDCDPSNNTVENLEWCNHKENLIHAYKNRLNQEPDPVVLVDLSDGNSYFFISKSEASRFLGRNSGYVSGCIKKGKRQIDQYEIFVQAY